jgi:hypothetical protein
MDAENSTTPRGKDSLAVAALTSFFLGILSAAAIVAWQVFVWLKTGSWPGLPLVGVILSLTPSARFWRWFAHPDSWLGLHRVVKGLLELPLSLWIIVGASALTFYLLNLSEESD